MAENSQSDRVFDLLNKLGISGHQLQGVKLGPGVVGRNSSIAWTLEVVMLAGVICAAILHNALLLGVSLTGAVVTALVVAIGNLYFGAKNPAAALLEGAQFLEYQHMQLAAAKGIPKIELSTPTPQPPQLPPSVSASLPEPSEAE